MKTSKIINLKNGFSHKSNYMSRFDIEEYQQAKNILERAEERAKNLCEQYQKDYEDELDRGYADGKKKADKETSEVMMQHSKRTIEHLVSIEQELVHIVEKSLFQMIGEFEQADLIKRMVSQHIQNARIENSITLRVHTEISDEVKQKFSLVPDVEKVLNIIPDGSLESFDAFVLDTPSGRIESGVSIQLETLINSFKENF